MPVATVILLSTICGLVQSSEFHPIAPAEGAPVVTAASSQYFERTFNRLVAAPAVQPVYPVAPPPPIVVDAKTTITPVIPTNPPQPVPADPNVAIAIATAHAAAPVATILLPPYPFGLPPLGLIPSTPTFNEPSENPNRESTTQKTTTTAQGTTTEKDSEVSPFPSNNDNSFAQAPPSNENVNFRQYLAPQLPVQPLPQPTRPFQQPSRPAPPPPRPAPRQVQPPLPQRPQKIKTTVEVVPVPLTYIAPPPVFTHSHIHAHIHDHHDHTHAHIKGPSHAHYHTFIPKKTKIIIRPVRRHTIRVPVRLVAYKPLARSSGPRYPENALRISNRRDTEPTTFRPFNRPMTRPPRL